jgi:DNA-binding NarL/FixJ family response regulator
MSESVELFYKVVNLGIHGFLSEKNYVSILEGIENITRTGVFLDEGTTKMLLNNFKNTNSMDLTLREKSVLKGLEEYLSYEQIAIKLGVKKSTINNHIERIYTKLNVSNKYEAISKSKEIKI